MLRSRPLRAVLLALLPCLSAHAAEGLWTFDRPPVEALGKQYGFAPDAAWLAALQGAAVNFGASASFVSPDGLALTNHHVVLGCASRLATPEKDIVAKGFVARSREEELRCPGGEASVLTGIEDVTARIRAAEDNAKDEAGQASARRAAITAIEQECQQAAGATGQCRVVSLYQGAVWNLYRSDRYDDVRLVFAPEYQAGFYGGDPDNFVYPRFALDVGLVRLYRDGKPVRPAHWLHIDPAGPKPGEPLFVAGHPGATQRLMTEAQLRELRDVQNPLALAGAQRRIDVVLAYGKRSPEAERQSKDELFGLQNWYKSLSGAQAALSKTGFLERKAAQESDLRARAAGKVKGDPWADISAVVARQSARAKLDWVSDFRGPNLLARAGTLVQWAHETRLPEAERLPEFRQASLPRTQARLLADSPAYRELDRVLLLDRLAEARELLGAGHPFVKAFEGEGAAALEQAIAGTKLDQAAERRRLIEAGPDAIDASNDPMLVLARRLEPFVRESRHFAEDQVAGPIGRAAARIEQARYAAYGSSVAPDATGTLRFSYGEVKGYASAGVAHPWKTTIGGLFDRAASFDEVAPFNVTPSWRKARTTLNPDTPFNYVLTADIVGGNSGSPIVNRAGDLVGLIFDGNPASLGNYYQYAEDTERAVAVHPAAILEALDKVYQAGSLVRELQSPKR
ncbi:S46 family peptidase [Uliginosibacterium paludis]|uniref:Dipeptidyl-peptidase n=1 Tax=Uliginosibacterium paludis TaxID=1615952 RepID=A0ABV2CQC2_9RHOO